MTDVGVAWFREKRQRVEKNKDWGKTVLVVSWSWLSHTKVEGQVEVKLLRVKWQRGVSE